MRRLLWGVSLLLALVLFLGLATGLSQAATFCSPGQQPHFSHGFAFLKSQLGEIMGQPVACERYDAAGNASQQTTTGQAFYDKETNTPMFTAGKSQVLIEGVRMIKKHQRKTQENPNGAIIEREGPIHISNVKLVEATAPKKEKAKAKAA